MSVLLIPLYPITEMDWSKEMGLLPVEQKFIVTNNILMLVKLFIKFFVKKNLLGISKER